MANTSIMRFQSAKQELGKASELKQLDVQLAAATPRLLCEQPTEPYPNIDEQHAEGHQEKTISRIGRSSPASNLAGTAVTGFNAEAPAIQFTDLTRRHVQVNQNVDLPTRAPLQAFGALGRGEYSTNNDVSCPRLTSCAIAEGMNSPVAFTTMAKGARAAAVSLASDGTGDQGRNPLLLQKRLDFDTRKAAVQQQPAQRDVEPAHLEQQPSQDIHFADTRQDKADTRRQAQIVNQNVVRIYSFVADLQQCSCT